LSRATVERELPFILQVNAGERRCFIHGRMDAVVEGSPPRVIDYKYSLWKPGAEAAYEMQMAAYSLALMKSFGTEKAAAELWYLKAPMKIVRQEYTLSEAEGRLAELLSHYLGALATGDWPKASRSYCEATFCGFIPQCWGSTSSGPGAV
jgi:CRISPR/Cas system-associated exonuclease Cas4 (RecB family)